MNTHEVYVCVLYIWADGGVDLVNRPTTHDQPHEPGRMSICHFRGHIWRVFRTQGCAVGGVCGVLCRRCRADWVECEGWVVCWAVAAWVCEWVVGCVFDSVL
jgi:hypothetical protein